MLGRRQILKLLTGAGAAAASGVSVREASQSLGIPENVASSHQLLGFTAEENTRAHYRAIGGIRSAAFRRSEARSRPPEYMPAHIGTKKSWSPAFKEHVLEHEMRIMHAYLDKLESDEAFARKVFDALGLDVGPPGDGHEFQTHPQPW